jgi:hypothetical protein
MDSTVRYLGIELEDALELSEGVEMWSFDKIGVPSAR